MMTIKWCLSNIQMYFFQRLRTFNLTEENEIIFEENDPSVQITNLIFFKQQDKIDPRNSHTP